MLSWNDFRTFGVYWLMARTLAYSVALLSLLILLIGRDRVMGRTVQTGLPVLLANKCPDDLQGDRRDVVVRYLPGPHFFLNEKALDRNGVREQVAKAMQTRIEKLVWIAADERVSYGEVVSIASDLMKDTPDLYLVLATKNQTGPVDPATIERIEKLGPKAISQNLTGVSLLCPGSPR